MRQLEFSAEARQRLLSQLGSLRSGCGEDITTPLLPRTGEDKDLLRHRCAESLTAFTGLGTEVSGRLRALEEEKRLKLGTFSRRPGYRYDALLDDSLEKQIQRYFRARSPVILHTKSADHATEQVSRLVPVHRIGKLSLIDLETAAAQKFPSSTGLGFPVVSSDSSKYLYTVYKISEEIHNSGYDRRWVSELPAILGVRGQPRGPAAVVGTIYAKTRVIYAMPRALMNVEKRIQYPLQGYLRNHPTFSAWVGRPSVAKAITGLFTHKPREILSVDFKSFDVSVPEVVLNIIFDVIRGWFTAESSPVITFAQEGFMRTGILCPDDYLPGSSRTGGVPSGSVLTNLIDSLVNLWVMHYAAHRVSSSVLFSLAQGDDGVYTFQGCPSKRDLSQAVSELGMTMSEEKSIMEKGVVHFLQDLHLADYMVDGSNEGMRPLTHILNSSMSQERIDGKRWDRDCDTIRWLQQWGEARFHPRFHAFCDWLYETDWMCRGLLARIRDDDGPWLADALAAVNRKDSNSFWGLSPSSFKSSPVVGYLTRRLG